MSVASSPERPRDDPRPRPGTGRRPIPGSRSSPCSCGPDRAVELNRERLAAAVRDLDGEPDLIVAPELCVTGYDLDHLGGHGHQLAETLQGPTVALAAELAAERRATVVVGLLEADDGRLYDSAVVAGPDGVLASYRKSHLYPPETAVFAAGDRLLDPQHGRSPGPDDLLRARLPRDRHHPGPGRRPGPGHPLGGPGRLRAPARPADPRPRPGQPGVRGGQQPGRGRLLRRLDDRRPARRGPRRRPGRGGRHRGHHRPGGDPARAATRAGAAPAPGRVYRGGPAARTASPLG